MTRRVAKFLGLALALVTTSACAKDSGKTGPSASGETASATRPADPPAAAPAPAPAKEGKQKVEGQGFVVEVKAPEGGVAAGQEGVARVVLTATGGYHLNKDFPNALDLQPIDGITFSKQTLKTADAAKFEEKEAVWEVRFTPAGAGEKKLAANFKFAVCTETTCDPQREALAWAVAVK